MSGQDDVIHAYATPTNIPGLYDVELSDGRSYTDLTIGQIRSLYLRENWDLTVEPGLVF